MRDKIYEIIENWFIPIVSGIAVLVTGCILLATWAYKL